MTLNIQTELLDKIIAAADDAVRTLVTRPRETAAIVSPLERLQLLQERFCREFPTIPDELEFWETLWRQIDRLRDQWCRMERTATRIGEDVLARLSPTLDEQRRNLYHWSRRFICEHAPRVPETAHFELGIDHRRSDYRGLHERLEGLYESIKRTGRLPKIDHNIELPADRVNVAVIYGGGWNVSAYSILRTADEVPQINAFVAFDHPGPDLYGRIGDRTVRLATAGLIRRNSDEDYLLAAFRKPVAVHFACPHQWTGPPAHELGLPILRSQLTLDIVDDKAATNQAMAWYAQTQGADLPLIREWAITRPEIPVDLDLIASKAREGLDHFRKLGIDRIVIKPCERGEEQGMKFFDLRTNYSAAIEHAVLLLLESNIVIQERIIPPGDEDFTWRVFVALGQNGEPEPTGRFARVGHGRDMTFVADNEILAKCGITGAQGDTLLHRLDRVAKDAFRAIAAFAVWRNPEFPWHPLGEGSYAVPYFLGVDLIGDAMLIEVNGHEVAGMWTDDRLYPETRGRTFRPVLQSALRAGKAYKTMIESGRTRMQTPT
jgi:hypothetical protein